MAKTIEHLSDFVFVSMANLTLTRRDTYLAHLTSGIKPSTQGGLRTASLHMAILFPDNVSKKAKEDIVSFESKGHSSSSHKKGRYHPYERLKKHKPVVMGENRKTKQVTTVHDQPRVSCHINDNNCVNHFIYHCK